MRIRSLEPRFGYLLPLSFGLLLLQVFFFSRLRLLRPVADDYCFASSLDQGFFNSLIFWYSESQFDLFTLVMNLSFVGIPIVLLPADLASLFSFLAALITFSFFILYLFVFASKLGKWVNFFLFILISSAILVYFLSSLIFVLIFENGFIFYSDVSAQFLEEVEQHFADVANSWLMWGVVNSSYLYPFIFSFLLLLNLERLMRRNILLIVFLGFLLGTIGYVLSATTFVMIVLIYFRRYFRNLASVNKKENTSLKGILLLLTSMLVGNSLSYFSVGAMARRAVLRDQAQVSLNSFVEVPLSISRILVEVFLNFGVIAPILLGVLLEFAARGKSIDLRPCAKGLVAIGSLYFLVLLGFIVLSEFLTYRAYWHYFSLKFCLFIVLAALGIVLSGNLTRRSLRFFLPAVSLCLLLTVTFLASISQVSNRYAAWSSGMNYGALGSPGKESPWVYSCYERLKKINQTKYYPEFRNEKE